MGKDVIEQPGEDVRDFIRQLVRALNENFDHLDGQGTHVVRQFQKLEERLIALEEVATADEVPEHDHSAEDEGDVVVQPVTDHLNDGTGAHAASAISYAGGTGMSATDVEAAVDELATEKADAASAVMDGDLAGGDLGGTYPNPTVTDDSHAHGAGTAPGTAHPDLATHDALGLATQAELDVPAFQRSGQSVNATISTSQNDWAPTGIETATVVQVEVQAAADLTGIAAAQDVGRVLILYSKVASVADLTLRDTDALSLAANRFDFEGSPHDIVLKPNNFLVLIYAATRWREYKDFDHRDLVTDAHDASAISIADAALDFDATDVEGALAELQADAEAHVAAENPHGMELDDLTDVAAPTPADGDVLTFDTVNGWQPEAAGGGAHPDLATHDALGLATQAELDAHTGDTADAHDASAISNVPSGNIAATDVQAAINELDSEKAATGHTHSGSEAFPVGSVFIGVVSTNPATLLGYGTWAAFGAGRVLVGQDPLQTEFDTAEETGGAMTHQHGSAGGHAHNITGDTGAPKLGAGSSGGAGNDGANHKHGAGGLVNDTMGAHTHDALSNLQPYIVVYMWKRTA